VRKWQLVLFLTICFLAIPQSAQPNDLSNILGNILGQADKVAPLILDDDQIGLLFAQGVEKKYGLDSNPQRLARVQQIGTKILAANQLTTKYDFAVLASHDFNACSIYGGHIRVNEGLLYDTQNNDAEAAFAIAHEIAHNELGHNKEAVRNFKIAHALDLTNITQKMPQLLLVAANAALAKRSRENETAADAKALEYMARAGYKTTGAIAMGRRIEAEHKIAQRNAGQQSLLAQRFNTIFDTHPDPAKRAEMAEDFYFTQKYGTTFKAVAGTSTTFPIAYAFDWPVGPPSEGVALDREQLSENNWYVAVKFREQYNGKAPHNAVDISQPGDSDLGQPVFAVADGVVKEVRQPTNEGDVPCRSDPWNGIVLIEHHPQGGSVVYSQSAHLRNLKVHKGDPVSIHQQIGEIGPKPYGSTGVHLHFEMRTNADIGISENPYRYDNPGYIDPIDFIKNHRHLGTPPAVPNQAPVIRKQFHLGDDHSQDEMVKDATFNFSQVNATLKLWIKGSPFKDPIIWINRHEVGRIVTTDDKWHLFTFPVPAQYLNNGQNLFHIESFIPDRWHTFDDCEVKEVWIYR